MVGISGLHQLLGFFCDFGREKIWIREEAMRVAAVGRRVLASDKSSLQRRETGADTGALAPARGRAVVTEPGRALTDDKAERIAIAVQIDAEQVLSRAGRLALDP